MALILATGSNIGDKKENLIRAKKLLKKNFCLTAEIQIYYSKAVDYMAQPNFFNQVLQFKTPKKGPEEILNICQSIEKKMGRVKKINKGSRNIDIDIIFIDEKKHNSSRLQIPHPRAFERSFVIEPLKELPFFEKLKHFFDFSQKPKNRAKPKV